MNDDMLLGIYKAYRDLTLRQQNELQELLGRHAQQRLRLDIAHDLRILADLAGDDNEKGNDN